MLENIIGAELQAKLIVLKEVLAELNQTPMPHGLTGLISACSAISLRGWP